MGVSVRRRPPVWRGLLGDSHCPDGRSVPNTTASRKRNYTPLVSDHVTSLLVDEIDDLLTRGRLSAGDQPAQSRPLSEWSLDEPSTGDRPSFEFAWAVRWIRFGQVSAAVMVVMVILGVLAASVATHLWDANRQRVSELDRTSILISVDPNVPGKGTTLTRGATRLDAAVIVTNAGPEAIRLDDMSASMPGVTLTGQPGAVRIKPAGTASVKVEVIFTCTADLITPLPVVLALQKSNGKQTRISLRLDAHASTWDGILFQTPCLVG
jgi:hypothetical protein